MFFPSKNALTPIPAWTEEAIERRLKGFDDVMQLMNKQMEGTTFNHQFLKDTIETQRDQLAELTMQQKNLGKENDALREELSEIREENSGLVMVQTELQRNHEIEVDDLERKQRYELENLRDDHRREVDRLRRETSTEADEVRRQHRSEIDEMSRKHREETEELEKRYKDELNEEKVGRVPHSVEILATNVPCTGPPPKRSQRNLAPARRSHLQDRHRHRRESARSRSHPGRAAPTHCRP
jgi:septal ring factor EnvC (AmiA/AmiB activator)